jgi:uroporphyrinogen decarboxylase
MTGSVIKPRFPTWDGFENFKAPDPSEENGWMKIDWEQIKNQIAMDRAEKKPVIASLRHGHTLLTLEYIRGYENLIMDLFDGDKRINELIKIVSDFNYELLKRFLQLGIDIMCFPEDTGMQQGPFLAPDMFATYIIPVYKRYFDYTHSKGVIVHMHSDGDLIKHADQLVEAGIDVINPQDLVNGIEALAECFKGKVAIDLDVDRQNITINGTPKDIDDLIHEEVEKLGDESGGLKLKFDLGAHVPEKNVEALAKSFQKYMFFYS